MNETIKTILNRRSIRAFKLNQIKDEELQIILKAGQFAPSAMNQQSWHFTIVQNKKILQDINQTIRNNFLKSGNKRYEEMAKSKSFSAFYNAPTLIIVSGDEKAIAPQCDCVLAMENIFLAALSIGIGSCWIHAITQLSNTEEGRSLISVLRIPQGNKIFASGAFGYPAVQTPAAAPRKENTITIIN